MGLKITATCQLCDELIGPKDAVSDTPIDGLPVHWECGFRAVMGGENHIRRTCTCYGGTEEPDAPGLTRRQAALMAYSVWRRQQRPPCARDD